MGRIGRLITTKIEKFIVQTVESYMGANVTAETFAPSGDDSPPLPDDRIILVSVDGSGNLAAAGVLSVSQGAKAGEKILYSRDKDGRVKAAISLLNDGKIEVQCFGDAGFILKDKAGNTVESTSGGMELTDCKGGNIAMAGKVTLCGKSGKIEVD